jgi:hypothetical protein
VQSEFKSGAGRMRISQFVSRVLIGTLVLLSFAVAGPASAQDVLKWTLSEGSDAASRGRTVARLVYGVPETDNQLFTGTCEARSSTSVSFSALTLAVDVGKLKNGSPVRVRFSGGGREHELAGEVTGIGNTNEGIAGIIVRPKHSDKLWSMMSELPAVDYTIPGYRTSVLNLKDGHSEIRSFVSACQSYESSLRPAAAAAGGGFSEKEAFDLAKELGTVDGWTAFLKQFPNGSRAGFAQAYMKRLAGSNNAPSTTPNAPATSTPAVSTATSQPAPLPKPTLSTVARGPATSRWANRTERMAIAGGRSVYTASVRVPGVELVTYCVDNSDGIGLGAVVRRKGSYPSFSERIRQGLAASPRVGSNREINIGFSNGETVSGGVAKPALVGGSLGIGPNAATFVEGSAELEYFMSENSVSVDLAPFQATFQLKGSRKAICAVMNRCGAQIAACGSGSSARPVQPVQPVTVTRNCSGGRYYNRSERQCVCPSGKPRWTGRSCQRERQRCGKNYKSVRGKCVLLQNCGRNAYRSPEGDCYCRKGFRRTGSGRCVRAQRVCGRGQFWNGKRCVFKQRRCSGGRQLDKQTGQCYCPGDSAWDGRRCFKNSGPRPPPQNNNKKNVCAVLQAACQFGAKAACKNFEKNGC